MLSGFVLYTAYLKNLKEETMTECLALSCCFGVFGGFSNKFSMIFTKCLMVS